MRHSAEPSRDDSSAARADWLTIGGWPQYASVIFEARVNGFAIVLVDVNGDGRDLCLDRAIYRKSEWQIEATDHDVSVTNGGLGWSPNFVYAWGRGKAYEKIIIDYANEVTELSVDSSGWWAYLAATSSEVGDLIAPEVAVQ